MRFTACDIQKNSTGTWHKRFFEHKKKYYVISSVDSLFARETAVFRCNKEKKVTDWTELVMVKLPEAFEECKRQFLKLKL